MTGKEALEYLNGTHYSTWKLGLERTKELLKRVGDPQRSLKFIHVVGTNGKGSTCAMLGEIFKEAGYLTGMYPSPYIEDFRERIQVNGELIGWDDLGECTGIVSAAADAMEDHPSQFELITAVGMLYFKKRKCDIVVLEAGLGGEFDSTNAIDAPEAAVICNIGLDHTEYLGDTVEKIAATKCGIIKPGSDVITYDNVPSVVEVIEKKAAMAGDFLYKARETEIVPLEKDLSGQVFLSEGKKYRLNLLGAHQLKNAQTVLTVVKAMRGRGWNIPFDAVARGLSQVRWPARFEVLSKDPVFILDGGHNPQCAEALSGALEEYLPGEKVTFLIGMLGDKDYEDVIGLIGKHGAEFLVVTPDSPRKLAAPEFAETIRKKGYEAVACDEGEFSGKAVEEAVKKALKTGRPVIAFGSLYLAGTVRKIARTMFDF